MSNKPRVAAIEAGGTKFVLGVHDDWHSCQSTTVPTTTPEETCAAVLTALRAAWQDAPFDAIGVASFGPIGVVPDSPNYGVIGATPKPGWTGFSFLEALAEFGVPIAVESDVNGAGLAEARHGAGQGLDRVVYVTVGTGIGGGFIFEGKPSNGFSHPEIGHMMLPRHSDDLADAGYCPFHGNCLEGLACGPSVMQRWNKNLSELGKDHVGFTLEAHYLALMCHNLILSAMPDAILIGGGVAQTPGLLECVRAETRKILNGYLPALDSDEAMANLIRHPELAPLSGLVGAFELAWDALNV